MTENNRKLKKTTEIDQPNETNRPTKNNQKQLKNLPKTTKNDRKRQKTTKSAGNKRVK